MSESEVPSWVPYKVGDVVTVRDLDGNPLEVRVESIRPGDDDHTLVTMYVPVGDPSPEPWYLMTPDAETPPPDPKV